MEKVKQFFSKKRNTVICIVTLAVLLAGGIGGVVVYGAHKGNQEAQQEAERIADRQAEIEVDLAAAGESVTALYSDDTLAFLAEPVTDADFTQADEALAVVSEYADSDEDMTEEQQVTYTGLVQELEHASTMYEVMGLYHSLHVVSVAENGVTELLYLSAPGDTTTDTLSEMAALLAALEDAKPDFYALYANNLAETETKLAELQEAIEYIDGLFDADGEVLESVTEEQITEAKALLENLDNPDLSTELNEKLQTVISWHEAQQTEEITGGNGSNTSGGNTGSNSSGNAGTNGGGSATTPPATTPGTETPSTGGGGGGHTTTEEPYIISGYVGNGGLFDTAEAAHAYARAVLSETDENGNFVSPYTGYQVITVLYSDGTVKHSVNMY